MLPQNPCLFCLSPHPTSKAGWECTRNWEGTQSGQLIPNYKRDIPHHMASHSIYTWSGPSTKPKEKDASFYTYCHFWPLVSKGKGLNHFFFLFSNPFCFISLFWKVTPLQWKRLFLWNKQKGKCVQCTKAWLISFVYVCIMKRVSCSCNKPFCNLIPVFIPVEPKNHLYL